jgi:hypothetical protein
LSETPVSAQKDEEESNEQESFENFQEYSKIN